MGEEAATHSTNAIGRSGDVQWAPALVELFTTRRVALVRLAYLLTGHPGVAEEVVQEAFISTHRSWERVREPSSYLRAAVVNGCRSWGRHQSVVKAHPPEPPGPNLNDPDELWDALGKLSERRRAAIVLRFYADLPHDEIATLLGCRPATVRTSIHRGLKQLRLEIER